MGWKMSGNARGGRVGGGCGVVSMKLTEVVIKVEEVRQLSVVSL